MSQYASNIFIEGNEPAKIDGNIFTPDPKLAAHYEDWVGNILDDIQHTITGEVLLREIRRGPMGTNLRIIPFPLADARTIPKDPLKSAPRGQQLRFPGDLPNTVQVEKAGQPRLDDQGKPMVGTGEGSNVTILYHPHVWMLDSYRTGHVGNVMPDDALVHELMHGLRMMSGLLLTNQMEDNSQTARYENTEEFYALLVANIYVSELNKKSGRGQKLRGNISAPNKFVSLTPDEAISQSFYQSHKDLIDRLSKEMIGLCHGGGQKGLMSVPADFNPIRDSEKFQEDLRMRMYGAGV